MMKRAVILHGTDGSPEINWFPWLKAKLEAEGYEVWVPHLPENHTPNREVYGDFLFGQGWDFADNLVIGHSSGAVEVLNLLMDERLPHVRLAVMVGAWKGDNPNGFPADTTQFDGLFPSEGFDFAAIKSRSDKIEFLHGDDDPYCPLEQAKHLAQQLDAPITVVPNGHHLGAKYTELPELWQLIGQNL
jgi:predicted alpha/beta hydrolase family esterase